MSDYCEYTETPDDCGFYVCANCGDRKKKRYHRECNTAARKNTNGTGVGDFLTVLIAQRYGVPPCGSCHEVAARMNKDGPVGVREKLDDYAEQLESNAYSRNWTALIGDAVRHPVAACKATLTGGAFWRNLILEAVELAEKTI